MISDVARRHGLRRQQLFNWRNEFCKREAGGGTPAFAPVMLADDRPATAPIEAPAPVADVPLIEIVIGCAMVRTRGAVDANALAAVLRAVKGRRMIIPPTNVQVLIATMPVDFRNYAKFVAASDCQPKYFCDVHSA